MSPKLNDIWKHQAGIPFALHGRKMVKFQFTFPELGMRSEGWNWYCWLSLERAPFFGFKKLNPFLSVHTKMSMYLRYAVIHTHTHTTHTNQPTILLFRKHLSTDYLLAGSMARKLPKMEWDMGLMIAESMCVPSHHFVSFWFVVCHVCGVVCARARCANMKRHAILLGELGWKVQNTDIRHGETVSYYVL